MPQREPEIEFLGKVARFGLVAFRVAMIVAALLATGIGLGLVEPPSLFHLGVGGEPIPLAHLLVGLCIGIPPLLPVRWLFGRGCWPMLAVGIALWFGPMWLEGDHDYGWVIRVFASLVAVSVLFVWKSIFALTKHAN